MSRHTPRPWTIEENEMMGRDIVSAAGRALICTQVYSPDDAALIAAAPELLAALSDLLSIEGIEGDRTVVINKAFAAIDKATGSES